MLNILVCVKQVPDINLVKMDPVTGSLIRAGVPAILNPLDANALEAAVPANFNLISMEGDRMGVQSFFGQGAGRYPTAYNVVHAVTCFSSRSFSMTQKMRPSAPASSQAR